MAVNPAAAAAAGPNPWLPFDGSPNDCSTGICSIYCPQWCYFIFPPPPPSPENSDPRTAISPLVIALIAALATVFLLLAYYTVISKYCRRRRRRRRRTGLGGGGDDPNADPAEEDGDGDRWRTGGGGSRGLDEAAIKSITVLAYKRGDGLVDGSDCSVCLSEFKEEESLRLLPKCNHAFHVGCIDMWLKSHSNCPLCRSNIAILSSNPNPNPPPAVAQGPQNSPESHASSLRIQRQEEALVMVVEDSVRVSREEILVMSFPKTVVESPPPPPPPSRRDEENRETRSPRDVIEITVPEEERFDSSVNRPSIRSIAAELGGGGEDDLRIANCRSSSITATGPSTQIEEERDPKSNDRSTIKITAQEEPRFDSSLQHRDEGDGKDWRTGNCRSSSMSGPGSSTQTEQEVDGKSNNRSTGEDLEAVRSHGSAEPHKGKNLIIIPN